jgi:hypothetical protein
MSLFMQLIVSSTLRIAALKVARPNYDWTNNYDYLSQVSAESDARNVEIVMTANRGSSLSCDIGSTYRTLESTGNST